MLWLSIVIPGISPMRIYQCLRNESVMPTGKRSAWRKSRISDERVIFHHTSVDAVWNGKLGVDRASPFPRHIPDSACKTSSMSDSPKFTSVDCSRCELSMYVSAFWVPRRTHGGLGQADSVFMAVSDAPEYPWANARRQESESRARAGYSFAFMLRSEFHPPKKLAPKQNQKTCALRFELPWVLGTCHPRTSKAKGTPQRLRDPVACCGPGG